MSNYADLEINLSPKKGDNYPIELRYSDLDDMVKRPKHSGQVQFDFVELLKKQWNPTEYGKLLSNSLFHDPELRSYFDQARDRAQTANKTLRLRLSIAIKEADELHTLRWETLRDPQDGSWMLTKEDLLFSRFLSIWEKVQLSPKADLRALVVIANPQQLKEGKVYVDDQTLQPIKVKVELERAQLGLTKMLRGSLVSDPDKPERVTLENLISRLREDEGYDILYLVCHGALLSKDPPVPYLWLEDKDGMAAVQPGSILVDYVRDLPSAKKPRLAVLASCQSGGKGSDVKGALAALGPSLVEAGIPAVIAMQGDVSMETVAEFMQYFFKELVVDGQIDRAMAAARGMVRQRPDSWMPVLYMCLERGQLWEEERDVEKPPFMAPKGVVYMVGRKENMEKLKQRLLNSAGNTVTILIQFPGVGKTELAVSLANDEEIKEHYRDGVLWAPLGKNPNMNDLLIEWTQELRIPPEETNLANNTEARFKAIKRHISNKRMLLIFDDAWPQKKEPEKVTVKVNDFKDILDRCDLVVTTRYSEVVTDLLDVGDPTEENGLFKLKELSEEDGLALLTALAPNAMKRPKDIELGRDLVRAVESLPLALVLMGRYLARESLSGQPHRISGALLKLQKAHERLHLEMKNRLQGRPKDMPLTLEAAIDMSVEELGEAARQALYMLSAFRPKPHMFSSRDAKGVFGIEYENLDDLINAGLLEFVSEPVDGEEPEGSAAEEGEEEAPEYYRLPRTIAEYALDHVTEAQLQEYHQKAVDYFTSILRNYEENRPGDATSYERMYSYEKRPWQAMKASWLYHQAQTSDRVEANLNLAQIYFDVFWWWRCYNKDFPFCDQILSEWRETQTSEEDRNWLSLLNHFQEAYPTGYEKQNKGDWQAVEETLHKIRRLGVMDGDLNALDHDRKRQHIRAITNFFLAESHRFRSVNDPRADMYYFESVSILEKHLYPEDDDWNLPWAYWHLADLALERGQDEKALDMAAKSLQLGRDASEGIFDEGRDNEVIGNDYRVRADVIWKRGQLEPAFQNYALAIFYAYLFQYLPKPPDFYTADFYIEMVTRTCNRLEDLWSGGQKEAALQACAYLRQFWQPYWELEGGLSEEVDFQAQLESGDLADLEKLIFPQRPTQKDMGDEDMEYVHQVLQVTKAMQDRVEEIG